MKRRKTKKLALRKETIRTLSSDQLARAAGGNLDALSIIQGTIACSGICTDDLQAVKLEDDYDLQKL